MKHEEHDIQMAIINYLRLNNFFCFAVPNGGQRNVMVAKNLKAEGVLAGVADIVIMMLDRIIFVEVKTNKGAQQQSQKNFQYACEFYGHEYMIWRSIDDAIDFVNNSQNSERFNWSNYIANN